MGKPAMPFVPVDSVESLGRKKNVGMGEMVGRQLDFYTIRTLLDITPGTAGAESQGRLNKLIEVISTRSQPIIVSVDLAADETDPEDLPAGAGTVSVFTLKFALEHVGAWEDTTPSLKDTLIGIAGFTADNVSVNRHASL